MFVDKDLRYRVVEKMTVVVDNILECVTIWNMVWKKRKMSL